MTATAVHHLSGDAVVGVDGTAETRIAFAGANLDVEIITASVSMTGLPADQLFGELRMWLGPADSGVLIGGTFVGSMNSSEWPPGALPVTANEFLTFRWSQASTGARCRATVRYRVTIR